MMPYGILLLIYEGILTPTQGGPLDTFYAKDGGPLGIWRQWASAAHGQAMKGGHFFPEENPDHTALLVKQFLSA
jgi:haloacetate dehalogenase